MADTGIAATVALLLLGAALFLALVWFILPYAASRACPRCGARQPQASKACVVCGAELPGPAQAHPGAPPYGFPPPGRPARPGVRVEGGVAYNRGFTRRLVTLATAAMGLGLGLRLLGMLGAMGVAGIPQVPAHVDGLLTVAGGLIAFVGFVFLDAA